MKKFPDLAAAGRELAEQLQPFHGKPDAFVVAIATAGVPVGAEVARQIQLPFELLIIRRLLVPAGAAKPVCAVSVAGTTVVDESLGPRSATPSSGLDHAIAVGLEQLAQREREFRGGEARVDLAGRNVILVDNGIHTGATMLVAAQALRRLEVRSIVVAVPVADPNTRAAIEREADGLVCSAWPEKFGHTGLWYQQLVRPTGEEIQTFFRNSLVIR